MDARDMWRIVSGGAAKEEGRRTDERRVERGHERAWREIRAKKMLAAEFRAAGMENRGAEMEREAEELRSNTAEARLLDGLGIEGGPNSGNARGE